LVDLAPLDFVSNIPEWCRKLSVAVNAALGGVNRTVSSVTLASSVTTTTVLSPHVTASSHITFTPTTVLAAAEIGNGTMYVSARTNATSFVITHASNTNSRIFSYMISNP
jgi:hypothetical protein